MLVQRIFDLAVEYAAWLVAGSVLSFLIGVILGPLLIVRLPADYFTYRRRHPVKRTRRHPLVHLVLTSAKNAIGAVLIVAGVCLTFLPGQGLITLLAGLVIMNYPGKFTLERWLVRRPRVLPALNWLRSRYGREPLLDPDDGEDAPRPV
jgi:archaellum biogenesis protein FlaJ (TadC family)